MEPTLTPIEARVLGCLIEKERTTPEYYPLTLNALVTAANQKSNRDPIMYLDDSDVSTAIDGLRQKGLLWKKMVAGSRVPKYEHALLNVFKVSEPEVAVLCVLLLRGPQTPGEVKGRTGRLFTFASLQEVQDTLEALAEGEDPMVQRLAVQPGKKEARYAHLLCGAVFPNEDLLPSQEPPWESQETASTSSSGLSNHERITRLEHEFESLREEFQQLKDKMQEFISQFE